MFQLLIFAFSSIFSIQTLINWSFFTDGPLGGIHKGRPADPPEGGFGKTGQNRTWGGGGFEVFGRPELKQFYSLFFCYFD